MKTCATMLAQLSRLRQRVCMPWAWGPPNVAQHLLLLSICAACRSSHNSQAEADVLVLQARLALLAQQQETAVLLAQVTRAGCLCPVTPALLYGHRVVQVAMPLLGSTPWLVGCHTAFATQKLQSETCNVCNPACCTGYARDRRWRAAVAR